MGSEPIEFRSKKFFDDVKKKYNNKYKYEEDKYKSTHNNINILCNIHGIFIITPANHLSGQECPECTEAKRKKKHIDNAKNKFISKAIKVHGKKYNYDNSIYKSAREMINIECLIHGEFFQEARSHTSGCGCQKCAKNNQSESRKKTNKEYINNFIKKHGNKFSYKNICNIENQNTEIELLCSEHGLFSIKAGIHRDGYACRLCAKYGFQDSLPATLYYLSINNGEAYKIGITNRSIKERYTSKDLRKIKIIKEWSYVFGKEARLNELNILQNFKNSKYIGPNLLLNGNSELFNYDILCLDIEEEDDDEEDKYLDAIIEDKE